MSHSAMYTSRRLISRATQATGSHHENVFVLIISLRVRFFSTRSTNIIDAAHVVKYCILVIKLTKKKFKNIHFNSAHVKMYETVQCICMPFVQTVYNIDV